MRVIPYLFLVVCASLAGCRDEDQLESDSVAREISAPLPEPGWNVAAIGGSRDACKALLDTPDLKISIVPQRSGNFTFVLQDKKVIWRESAGFFVLVNNIQSLGSLRMERPDGTYYLSTNNSINFDFPPSVLLTENAQIDLYDFASGNYLTSYSLRNTTALSDHLRDCQTGDVASLPIGTPVRQPSKLKIDSILPKNEEDLYRLLSGGGSEMPVDDDGNTSWVFRRLSQGTCYGHLMTHKAKYGVIKDYDGESIILDIQNKSKGLDQIYVLETEINGDIRVMEPYDLLNGDRVEMIQQRHLPPSIFNKDVVTVKVLISDPELDSKLWDTFQIRSPGDVIARLDSC